MTLDHFNKLCEQAYESNQWDVVRMILTPPSLMELNTDILGDGTWAVRSDVRFSPSIVGFSVCHLVNPVTNTVVEVDVAEQGALDTVLIQVA